jgi:aspartate aminotransferase
MKKLSFMSDGLVGSQILELAEQIKQKIRAGEKIYNLTIGDFDPAIFPIPDQLREEIARAYLSQATNYPASNGIPELREAISLFIKRKGGMDYPADNILVSSGARPLIFATYLTLIDPGEKVLFPIPSWNNNFYSHIAGADKILIETSPEDNFMPTAAQIAPHIQETTLVALCSPLNPTGTVFSQSQLEEICDLIVAENKRRGSNQKPVYLLFDQIYWNLTYKDAAHYDPVSLKPAIKPYTILIDGLSKAFAATGLRLGWAYGPSEVIHKMKLLLAHVGSWASKPVQVGSANYLINDDSVDGFLTDIKDKLHDRLEHFYQGFQKLKNAGYPVDAIAPQAALYLTVKLELENYLTPDGEVLDAGKKVYQYLLDQAGVAMVPFYAFGLEQSSVWYRLSVGTAKVEEIPEIFTRIETALNQLKPA